MTETTPVPTPPGGPDPAHRTGRGLRIALFVSLAINIAVAGMVAGALLRHHGDRDDGRPPPQDFAFRPFTDALGDADRAALRRAVAGRMEQLREWRAERAAQNAALLALLRAEPFDRAALEARVAEDSARAAERAAFGLGLIVDRVAAMTPGERRAFADRLEDEMRRRDGRPPSR